MTDQRTTGSRSRNRFPEPPVPGSLPLKGGTGTGTDAGTETAGTDRDADRQVGLVAKSKARGEPRSSPGKRRLAPVPDGANSTELAQSPPTTAARSRKRKRSDESPTGSEPVAGLSRARGPVQTAHRREFTRRFNEVLKLLESGSSLRSACASTGMPRSSIYNALADDPGLAERLEAAAERGLARLEASITTASQLDWRAAKELLAVRVPEVWSRAAQERAANPEPAQAQASIQGVIVQTPRIEAMMADPREAEVVEYFLDTVAGRVPRPDWRITRLVSHPDSARELRELLDRDDERHEREQAALAAATRPAQ